MTQAQSRPMILIILDGWGEASHTPFNAITRANHPTWNSLLKQAPHTLLACSGLSVGLPEGQMGNSEVGHLHISAGRTVQQGLSRINQAIETGEFFTNPTLVTALNKAQQNNKAVHLLGLLSPGGVHSHETHFYALITLAKRLQISTLFIHVFLDGRDNPPCSALNSLLALEKHCRSQQCGQISSLIGRYYAMDRDERWERIEKAYHLLVQAKATFTFATAQEGLLAAYARGEQDEFVQATSIHPPNQPPAIFREGDCVISMNFRADRARQLMQALIEPTPHFTKFQRLATPQLADFVCMVEYDTHYQVPVIFPPTPLPFILPDCISQAGLQQLRIAETEKYAHVTFFFNGGREEPYPGEKRLLIPSPKIATYDLQPAMSALTITTSVITAIKENQYKIIICNFANPDMLGHTGNLRATIQAIEVIDSCLARIITAVKKQGGELLITADHGNAEYMFDETTHQPHTAHTTNPVPFIYVGPRKLTLRQENGQLSDVAPTILSLLHLAKPNEMTSDSLILPG